MCISIQIGTQDQMCALKQKHAKRLLSFQCSHGTRAINQKFVSKLDSDQELVRRLSKTLRRVARCTCRGDLDGALSRSQVEMLETWLILEYCDHGSFDTAIRSGRYVNDLVRAALESAFDLLIRQYVKLHLLQSPTPSMLKLGTPRAFSLLSWGAQASGVLCLMDIAAGMEHLHSLGVLHVSVDHYVTPAKCLGAHEKFVNCSCASGFWTHLDLMSASACLLSLLPMC